MRVLVACEFSGVVREAFRKKGHDAWSCDIIPAWDYQDYHLLGDVRSFIDQDWDLMIAHPPCTYLAVSGNQWAWQSERIKKKVDALNFVSDLMSARIRRIAIENPVGAITSHIRKPDQIIQPYEFGHYVSKKTCLWLKNLPLLRSTRDVRNNPDNIDTSHLTSNMKTKGGIPQVGQTLSPSADRGRLRSITFQGIADAMADQWDSYG